MSATASACLGAEHLLPTRSYASAAPLSISRPTVVPGRQPVQQARAEAWSKPLVGSRGTPTVYSSPTSSFLKQGFGFHDPKGLKHGVNTTTIAAASYFPGDRVEARWGSGDIWFPATISANCGDGTFVIDWQDGNTHGRTKRFEDLRRFGSTSAARPMTTKPATATTLPSSTTPVTLAGRTPAAAMVPAAGTSCSPLTGSTIFDLPSASRSPSSPSARPSPHATLASAVHTATATSSPASLTSSAATLPPEGPQSVAEQYVVEQPEAERYAPEQPVAGRPMAQCTGTVGASECAAEAHETEAPQPSSVAPEQSVTAPPSDLAESEPGTLRARDDVKCFMVELADGETCVVVQRADGKRWRFQRNSIDFELACDAEALQTWLGGLSDQQMPGLLTLLADEVNSRGARLKTAEKERDALRGTEDYEFFGLDGNACSDKDVEKAYRKMSTMLHPDKGGDEQSFNAMRERYDQIKSLRGESRRQGGGGGAIRWDPNCRDSMLTAHSDLREQLIWITKLIGDVEKDVEERRKRQQTQRAIAWDCPEAEPPGHAST
mmetsp:Transcript_129518/g.335957  ORF Transcript_129518/g.335957 Transcript_129518/m.335957 type:complete len:550 (-) Transcript_129518:61-1710(-)